MEIGLEEAALGRGKGDQAHPPRELSGLRRLEAQPGDAGKRPARPARAGARSATSRASSPSPGPAPTAGEPARSSPRPAASAGERAWSRERRSLKIKIPAGDRRRHPAEGPRRRGGRRPGHAPRRPLCHHPRSGSMIFSNGKKTTSSCEIPLSFAQAALGARIEIPTFEGNEILKVPAGVQSGRDLPPQGQGHQGRRRAAGKGTSSSRSIVKTPDGPDQGAEVPPPQAGRAAGRGRRRSVDKSVVHRSRTSSIRPAEAVDLETVLRPRDRPRTPAGSSSRAEEHHHLARVGPDPGRGDGLDLRRRRTPRVWPESRTSARSPDRARRPGDAEPEAPRIGVVLGQALIKPKNMDLVVQKAAELGCIGRHPRRHRSGPFRPAKERADERSSAGGRSPAKPPSRARAGGDVRPIDAPDARIAFLREPAGERQAFPERERRPAPPGGPRRRPGGPPASGRAPRRAGGRLDARRKSRTFRRAGFEPSAWAGASSGRRRRPSPRRP